MSLRVVIVGRGRVGRGLKRYLAESDDISVRLVRGSTKTVSDVDVLLLAVPDAHIASVAARLARSNDAVLLHCAGRLGVGAFGGLPRAGLGALHPLVSFARASAPPPNTGYGFAISGDARAKKVARRLVKAMGGHVLPAVHGDAYHAAAALTANGAAAISDVAIDVFVSIGVPRKNAARALAGLLHSVAYNIEKIGTPEALTGPVMRGDIQAIEAHREALERNPRGAYDLVGRLIVGTAKRAGLGAAKAKRLLTLLE
ncbi:MAG: putative short-subunit dehydrogenase-like oxidoreductase (DUF2520 family) [Polyangiales bacterium]|jgi:predicted short-subunit dehydrogenase-like oxidoreductase (DUF2520 family)